jgi:hypothetical protein
MSGEPLLGALVDVLNEGHPAYRRSRLDEIWGENACFRVDGQCIATGRDELAAGIEAARDDPSFLIRLRDPVKQTGDREWSRWEVHRLHREAVIQDVVARRSGDMLAELQAEAADPTATQGKFQARILETVLSNPIPAIGALGGALYLALRIPVGLFYGDLGVTPDEVGFGPQVLVPQSLTLLGMFLLAIMSMMAIAWLSFPTIRAFQAGYRVRRLGPRKRARLVYAVLALPVLTCFLVPGALGPVLGFDAAFVLTFVLMGLTVLVSVALVGRMGRSRPHVEALKDRFRRARSPTAIIQAFAILGAVYLAIGLLIIMPIWALADADHIRSGHAAGGRVAPWRAIPVSLRWTKDPDPTLTNDCSVLRLLGVANGEIVLFDTKLDRVFRIPVDDADAHVQRHC